MKHVDLYYLKSVSKSYKEFRENEIKEQEETKVEIGFKGGKKDDNRLQRS
jgi:hypothetical protein